MHGLSRGVLCGRSFFLYWFLITLFLFFVINTIVVYLLRIIKIYSKTYETLAYLVLSLLFVYINSRITFMYDGVGIINLMMYPYYCLGIVVSRFNLQEKLFENKWLYTISLLTYSFGFYLFVYAGTHGLLHYSSGVITALSAIIVVMYCFKHMASNWQFDWLKKLGSYTLEIYLLHFLFLVKSPMVGDFYQRCFNAYGFEGSFVPELIISLILTVINIYLCLFIRRIISHSPIVSKALLGR